MLGLLYCPAFKNSKIKDDSSNMDIKHFRLRLSHKKLCWGIQIQKMEQKYNKVASIYRNDFVEGTMLEERRVIDIDKENKLRGSMNLK